jgi:PAS domain S-box-containing protein
VEVSADAVVGRDGSVLGAAMVVQDVTDGAEEGHAHELASAAVARLAQAVVVIRVRDGRLVYANEAAAGMFGVPQAELVGRHVSSLHVPAYNGSGERTREILAALDADGVWPGDAQAQRADGSPLWYTARISAIEHREHGSVWIAAYADCTEHMAAEDARRDAETRFRALFEDSPIPIAMIGPDLRVLDVNDVACELTGFARAELVGRSLAHITHPDDVARDADLARRFFTGEIPAFRAEKRLVTKQGVALHVAVSTTAVRGADSRPAYGIATIEMLSPDSRRAGTPAWP